ncbi:MAG: MlaD family protein [Chitinophagales bacterium]
MSNEITRNIRLGIFVIAGTVLLIVALYFIGTNRNMFGKTFTLYTTFKDVAGLQKGHNVRYAGIDVGTVQNIEIVNDTTIRVELLLDAKLKQVIRKNSIATLGNDGLMGNKLVNIEPGTPDVGFVAEKDELPSRAALDMDEMLRTLDVTNKNIAVVSANLRSITDNINTGRGTLYTVLMDTTLSQKIKGTVDKISGVSDNILRVSADLAEVVKDVKGGKGLAGTLLKDTAVSGDLVVAVEQVRVASEKINASAGELKLLLENINTGSGTVSTLINDTATSGHLKQTLLNIENSARNFNENMEALKHNFLLRGYFKKLEKKKAAEQKTK